MAAPVRKEEARIRMETKVRIHWDNSSYELFIRLWIIFMKKTWNVILKLIIAVASAVAGVIGGQTMMF